MRKTLGVFLLTLLLAGSASAGDMGNDSPAPPPPKSASTTEGPTTEGIMQNDVAGSMTQIALNLLAVLPSLP